MISLTVVFWMYLILFSIIGAMRGWAKELIVTFGVVLAIFILTVLETYVGIVRNSIVNPGGPPLFWLRTTVVILLVFFAYQTPNIRAIAGARFARERLQDTLLGLIIGALNGYLVVGTVWSFLHDAGYPFPIIQAPQPTDAYYETAQRIINFLPPQWLVIPWVYFAVGIAFLFIIVVFI